MNTDLHMIYNILLETIWWVLSNASLIVWIYLAIYEILVNKAFAVTNGLISQLFVVTFVDPIYMQIALICIVATTHQNSTCNMLTSAKLSVGYLVVGITKELNKEPSLHCSSIYINYIWSVLQQYLPALMSMPLPHVLLLRLPYYIHVPWRHTL